MNENDFLIFFKSLFDEISNDEDINMETEFRYLEGWTSLTGLYFLTDMQEKYGKQISIPEFKSCETIQDLYNLYIKK